MAPPTTLWRLRLPDGSVARCVLVPAWPKHGVVWYVDDEIRGVEEFLDLSQARERAQGLRDQMASGGR